MIRRFIFRSGKERRSGVFPCPSVHGVEISAHWGVQGFSLVEIVMSLGIISFALLSMLGLLSVTLHTDSESRIDTDLASMSRQVYSEVRAMPFSKLSASNEYYFTKGGSALGTSPSNDAYYKCAITLDESSLADKESLKRVELKFYWPHFAPNPSATTFQTLIANYEP